MIRSFARRALKLSAATADRFRPRHRGVVVLIYHRVGGESGMELDLPTDVFEAQMAELAASNRVIALDDALATLRNPAAPELDPVVVTFDDGTADFADVATPILIRHQVPVTLYLSTDFVERGRPFPGVGTPLSWAALRDVVSTGLVTVGSHTHTHALLDRVTLAEAEGELDRSRDLIADRLGRPARHFAYPKAVKGSQAVETAVRDRFVSAALGGCRPNPYGRTDPYRLARSPVQASDQMRFFRQKAAGGMALEEALRGAVSRVRPPRARA